MPLDTPTIAVLSFIVDIVILLILIHAWKTRTTYPGFLVWIVGTACWTIGVSLNMLLYPFLPPFVAKVVGVAFILLHPALLYEGLVRFYRIPWRRGLGVINLSIIAAGLAGALYFLYVTDNINARIVSSNLPLALLFGRIAIEPLFYRQVRSHSMQWLLSLLLLPLVCLLLLRAWAGFLQVFGNIPMVTLMVKDHLLRSLMTYGIVVEIVIAYSYLSLTSDRVEAELTEKEQSLRELSASLQQQIEEETRLRLGQERRLANHSRLAAMGEMISAIAHQLGAAAVSPPWG